MGQPDLAGDESLFLNDHGALFGLRNRIGSRLGLLPACVVLHHAFAVIDVPHIVFLVDPDRCPALGHVPQSVSPGRKPSAQTDPLPETVWGALTHPGLWNRPVCSRIEFTHPTGEILTPGGLSIRLRSPNREVVSFDAVAGPSRVWMTEAAVNNLSRSNGASFAVSSTLNGHGKHKPRNSNGVGALA